jgi:hypothetical protein
MQLIVELNVDSCFEHYEKCGMDGYWKKIEFDLLPPVGTRIWVKQGPLYQNGCYDGLIQVTGYDYHEDYEMTTVQCDLIDEFDLENAGWTCGSYFYMKLNGLVE